MFSLLCFNVFFVWFVIAYVVVQTLQRITYTINGTQCGPLIKRLD